MTAAAYLTIDEAAEYLAVSRSTIVRLLAEHPKPGQLTRVYVTPRCPRIPLADVESLGRTRRKRVA